MGRRIHTFFDASFWTSFFDILARLDAKMLDFGTPLAPSCVPKWHPKPLKYRQKAQKKHPGRSLFVVLENDLLPISLLERSWAPFWSILGPLGSKIMDFRMIFFTFSFWTDVTKINQKSAKICQESAKNQLVNDCIETPSSHPPAPPYQRGPRAP